MASTGTTKFTVNYENGDVAEYRVKPRHLVAWEDKVGDLSKVESLKDSFYLTYLAAGTAHSFDEWLELVDSIESDAPEPSSTVEVPTADGEATEAVPTE